MKASRVVEAVAVAGLLILTAMGPAMAAPGEGGGGGGGGGENTTGSTFSDLVIALRAENGTPILKRYEVPATTETEATTEYCVQPLSYEQVPGVTSSTNPVDGRTVWVLPLQGEWILDPPDPLPVAEIEACDPWPQYAMFVSEVDLERLNLARTADEVIARKLADVALKLGFAEVVSLQSTGRISFDGSTIDASPENAAMYQSLMTSGSIPGLSDSPTTIAGPPAQIGPDGASNSRFDAWELAAVTIGAAAAKSTPLTLDAIEYYNRIIGFPAVGFTPPAEWPITFNRSMDPSTDLEMATGEQFVNYSGFTYSRSQTFKGSITWLDVPTLTWKVSKIMDVVPFTNLSSGDPNTGTLTGITGFAQLADDVRALCNFIPDNTFLPGFYMDVPGVDTYDDQVKAIHDPAVDLGTLPENVFQSYTFPMTASLLNPWGGDLIDEAQLRITVDAADAFAEDAVIAISGGEEIPFTVDGNGDLVGTWGPPEGFPVDPGYNVSTTFDVTVADGAPVGDYAITLELIDVDDPAAVLADETGTIMVNANVATVLWGDSLPKLATQGVSMTIPVQVYSPAAGAGQLTLTVSGPGDDPTTPQVEVTLAGDVQIYASNGTDMVPMPLALNGEGQLVGTWDAALVAGYNSVAWYAKVAEGALVGNYAFGVSLTGGNTLVPLVVSVSAPESHGQQPPDTGDDTTAPVVAVTPVDTLTSTATFTLEADEVDVTFECLLTTNGAAGAWEACTSPKSYTGLPPATYDFSARATDLVGNVSLVVTQSWTVTSAPPAATDPPQSSSGSAPTGPAETTQPGAQAGGPDQSFGPAPAATRMAQTARIRAQASGRYPVGTVLVLARQAVKTSAGVTVRWRVAKEFRATCAVRTIKGKATVTLLKAGTCRVLGYAPAPSPEFLPFSVQRTYRAVR